MTAPLLEVENLAIEFATDGGVVRAVDGISFSVAEGETVALVGESGCGKTVTGLSLLGLVPSPPGRVASGAIRFLGEDLLQLDDAGMQHVRGSMISMIFQEPMTALNPVFRIGSQMTDVLRRHQGLTSRQARAAAIAPISTARPAKTATEAAASVAAPTCAGCASGPAPAS